MNRIFMEVNDITDLQLSWDVILDSEKDNKDNADPAVFMGLKDSAADH